MQAQELAKLANELRIDIIEMLMEAKSGHPGGSLSAIDIITALWFHEMRGIEPGRLADTRDRFVLSKGHAVPALYAVLAKKGFIPHEELKTLRRTGSRRLRLWYYRNTVIRSDVISSAESRKRLARAVRNKARITEPHH